MSLSKTAAAKTQTQFANVGAEEISLSSGLSAYLVCVQIALAKASPKENASAKRKTKFPVEIVKIVFSPPLFRFSAERLAASVTALAAFNYPRKVLQQGHPALWRWPKPLHPG